MRRISPPALADRVPVGRASACAGLQSRWWNWRPSRGSGAKAPRWSLDIFRAPVADESVKISGRVGRRTSETCERTTSADRRKRCGSACPTLPCKHFHSVVAIQVWWGRRFRLPKERDFFTDPSANGTLGAFTSAAALFSSSDLRACASRLRRRACDRDTSSNARGRGPVGRDPGRRRAPDGRRCGRIRS